MQSEQMDTFFLPGLFTERGSEEGPQAAGERQPIIGIPVPVQQGTQGPLLLADAVGAWSIERVHGRIFLIPLWPFPTHAHVYQSLWSLLLAIDGLFLPASVPEARGRRDASGPEHWPVLWEIALAQLATFIGMPVLALADSALMWNSALGGEKMQVEEVQKHTSPASWKRHTLRVRMQSRLAAALQPALLKSEQELWELPFEPGLTAQHLAPGLRTCAQTEDGALAAFERKDAAFGIGMLGRLDWTLEQGYTLALLEAFLQACHTFEQERRQQAFWDSSRDQICEALSDRVARQEPLLAPSSQGGAQHSGPLAAPDSGPLRQEKVRQRAAQPSKAALNQMRRQRLKGALIR